LPRACTVCTHPQRHEAERALLDGTTFRTIADRFDLSETALKRHKRDHLPGHVAQAKAAAVVADADDLLGQLQSLRQKALDLLTKAEQAGDYRTALMGIREARGCVETLLEVEGNLDRRGVVNITVSADWIQVRTAILASLAPYPEAAQAVAAGLHMIEGRTHAGD